MFAKHARFVLKEPRGECLENNLAILFDRHLSLHAMRGGITLPEFPVVKARKPL